MNKKLRIAFGLLALWYLALMVVILGECWVCALVDGISAVLFAILALRYKEIFYGER